MFVLVFLKWGLAQFCSLTKPFYWSPFFYLYRSKELELNVHVMYCTSNSGTNSGCNGETIPHLFFHYKISDNCVGPTDSGFPFNLKDVVCNYRSLEDGALEYQINSATFLYSQTSICHLSLHRLISWN